MEVRTPDKEIYNKLYDLIHSENNTEHECREYLKYAHELLFKETLINLESVENEYRGHLGDSDYIVVGEVKDESGVVCKRSYIWELKAPQCYLFEKDTENRLKPTNELINAENQLLNYHYEQSGSDNFSSEFDVKRYNVNLGGIIIGCLNNLVKNIEEDKKSRLYEKSITIRRIYFYDRASIRLMTWDSILEFLSKQGYQGKHWEEKKSIPVTAPELMQELVIQDAIMKQTSDSP